MLLLLRRENHSVCVQMDNKVVQTRKFSGGLLDFFLSVFVNLLCLLLSISVDLLWALLCDSEPLQMAASLQP